MVLLGNDEFLSELTRLFQAARTSSPVSLTMKRYDGSEKPHPREGRPPLPESTENLCLIRASRGSKKGRTRNEKISTIVKSKDVTRFHLAYSSLLKGNMDGLKKMKKSKPKVKTAQ